MTRSAPPGARVISPGTGGTGAATSDPSPAPSAGELATATHFLGATTPSDTRTSYAVAGETHAAKAHAARSAERSITRGDAGVDRPNARARVPRASGAAADEVFATRLLSQRISDVGNPHEIFVGAKSADVC